MGEALILETTFLVDLEREDTRGRPGRAFEFLETHEHDRFYIIGTGDLWIAATAQAYEMPLVTANVAHFKRVPDLDVREY